MVYRTRNRYVTKRVNYIDIDIYIYIDISLDNPMDISLDIDIYQLYPEIYLYIDPIDS
jgi:hypothetical protein